MSELERIAAQEAQKHRDITVKREPKTVYCHFGSLSPKNEKYGLFSCIISSDKYGYNIVARKVMAIALWEQQQYVTYCQSFWYALRCIWEWQGKMINCNIQNILLVTNKSVLVKWIENPLKSRYKKYMHRAYNDFKVGGKTEILISIGLMKPMAERATKYCKMEFVDNPEEIKRLRGSIGKNTIHKLNIEMSDTKSIDITNVSGLADISEV